MDYAKENIIELERKNGKLRYLKFCYSCGEYFVSTRVNSYTCSVNCKQTFTRRIKKNLEPIVSRDLRNKPTAAIYKKFGFTKYSE